MKYSSQNIFLARNKLAILKKITNQHFRIRKLY